MSMFGSFPHSTEKCGHIYFNSNIQRFYASNCYNFYFFFCKKNREISFEAQPKTWHKAQEFCLSQGSKLADSTNENDLNSFTSKDFPVWIGLHQDDNLVLVKENKTWEEALEHCRDLGRNQCCNNYYLYHNYYDYRYYFCYDLASVQPGDDHQYIVNRIQETTTDTVWVSLRFLAGEWLWVNTADQEDFGPSCPVNGQQCGVLTKTASVEARDCTERRNFLCYSKC
ncbi:hypothetical protein LDENG_00189790 [Lucifuga dentata]|nr:hypothetical protein LDENG_00189790 [Lucifuga dentata]